MIVDKGISYGKNNRTRIIYIDILNIIAIIAVLALHCNGIVHGTPNTRSWDTSLIVECLCYFAVPLFCMLSGATLMNYREKYDTKTFFKKRITKVVIPFIFGLYLCFYGKYLQIDLTFQNMTLWQIGLMHSLTIKKNQHTILCL